MHKQIAQKSMSCTSCTIYVAYCNLRLMSERLTIAIANLCISRPGLTWCCCGPGACASPSYNRVPHALLCTQVQDEAAGLVVALLDPQPGETILDACAAPGGKALYAASRMQNQVSCRKVAATILCMLQISGQSFYLLSYDTRGFTQALLMRYAA